MVEAELSLKSEDAASPYAVEIGRVYLEIVDQMRRLANAQPYRTGSRVALYRRRLPGGLTVEFYLAAATTEYVLACAREDEDPTVEECAAAAKAFGAPLILAQSEPVKVKDNWHVVKYRWSKQHDQWRPR